MMTLNRIFIRDRFIISTQVKKNQATQTYRDELIRLRNSTIVANETKKQQKRGATELKLSSRESLNEHENLIGA